MVGLGPAARRLRREGLTVIRLPIAAGALLLASLFAALALLSPFPLFAMSPTRFEPVVGGRHITT